MRPALGALLIALLPVSGRAQSSVASDLWRVAAGTEVVPLSLAEGGTAGLWTPAVSLPAGDRLSAGVETVNAPSDLGVSGALLGMIARVRSLGLVTIGYGRINVSDIALTETSPEAIGSVPVYNQALSLGLAREVVGGLTGGLAVRYLSGELGGATRDQMGLDAGLRLERPHVLIGASTRFFDPTLRAAAGAASYNAGIVYRSSTFDAWGSGAVFLLRYGITGFRGERAQHLVTAGLGLGTALALDAGASFEEADGSAVTRSRLGLTIGSGRFRFQIGRDGGVNDFGATYRFAFTGTFK